MFRTLALAALILTTAPAAFARGPIADGFNTVYVCYSEGVADGGYSATVRVGGIAGITQVSLSAITIAGARPIGSTLVKREDKPGVAVYVGRDLRLEIGTSLEAELTAEIDGQRVVENMRCTRPSARLLTVALDGGASEDQSCKALWSGWDYDMASGRCMKQMRSGCHNPFAFKSQTSCEQAHSAEILN